MDINAAIALRWLFDTQSVCDGGHHAYLLAINGVRAADITSRTLECPPSSTQQYLRMHVQEQLPSELRTKASLRDLHCNSRGKSMVHFPRQAWHPEGFLHGALAVHINIDGFLS